MASIEQYNGKDGLTYRITVYAGFDTQANRKGRTEGSSGL